MVIAAIQCGFKFNSDDNLIKLEKYVKDTGLGRHGNHPKYNEWVLELLDQELQLFDQVNGRQPDNCESKEILLDIITNDIVPAINENTSEKINDLGKRKLGK